MAVVHAPLSYLIAEVGAHLDGSVLVVKTDDSKGLFTHFKNNINKCDDVEETTISYPGTEHARIKVVLKPGRTMPRIITA